MRAIVLPTSASHVRDHGFQGVAIIWIAGQRLHMGDELAALAVLEGGGNADLDADLWTTPALQVGFDKMLNRSAPIYPASKWSCCSEPTWISARFCPQ
jgi:hypothetical protein